MHQQLQTGYGETSDAQVLELPYEGDRVSMIVVLPRGKNRLADLEKRLSAKHLAAWEQSIAPRKVSVYLPRFTMTAEFNLNAAMRKLGMTDAFDGSRADFSGMDGLINNLFISEIIHKAFVEVNEEGTEAAAATAIIMRTTAMIEEPPVPEFRADRPFLFFIKDRVTGSILFIGRYVKPDAQG
jgi:serpin B